MPAPAMISLLLPTRGRPDMLERMIRSARDLATEPDSLEIVVNVDEDDHTTLALDFNALSATLLVGPPGRSMGRYNTECWEKSRGVIVILCNDDVIVRTQGWDTLIREAVCAFEDEVYLMYPNDLLKMERLCTFPVLSRKTCDLLSSPFPEAYGGAFIDTHLMDVFQRLRKHGHNRVRYLPDVVFEHCHYRTGKSDFDETYRARDRFGDDRSFLSLLPLRRAQGQALLHCIEDLDAPISTPSATPAPGTSYLGGVVRLFTDTSTTLGWRSRLAFHFLLRWGYQTLFHRRPSHDR